MNIKKMKLMIVDDEIIIQKLFRDFLQDEYDIVTATNGEEAMTSLETTPVDVVFCDIHMPRMDGIEVLKKVKEKYQALPVIMMDSFPEITSKKLEDMGAFAFIHKPFYLREIKDVLKEVIDSGLTGAKYSGTNRRKDHRFPSVLELTYKIEGIEGHDHEKTLSKNISSSGMLLETSQYMKKDMILILKIRLPGERPEERYLSLKAQVRWCMEKRKGERYDTGVQFLEHQDKELKKLKALIENYFV
ncbi:MAG: response regulator [Candidatus Aureabacteria bacterium]|nr:response regulator [Candidatus Auribacterota bacterium]